MEQELWSAFVDIKSDTKWSRHSRPQRSKLPIPWDSFVNSRFTFCYLQPRYESSISCHVIARLKRLLRGTHSLVTLVNSTQTQERIALRFVKVPRSCLKKRQHIFLAITEVHSKISLAQFLCSAETLNKQTAGYLKDYCSAHENIVFTMVIFNKVVNILIIERRAFQVLTIFYLFFFLIFFFIITIY